ncbi:MAG: LysR family transcriptional regulator [Alphaproteobacteria bacterium]|nr:LysR family transcriptional regulator [Alphaproteobacteria bacterium]
MTPLPTLRQLQFFTALARRKSFSKAAEDCLVSQSTLSSAIKELEGLLGCQLVDRSTRKFGLTPAGEECAARAAPILAMAEDLVLSTAARKPLEGAFQLGVIPTIAPFLLPKVAPRLKRDYPKLKLYLREDLTDHLVERLTAGLIDAAVLAFPYDVPGADTIEIGEDPFWFVCRRDHPLADKKTVKTGELAGVNLLLLEDGHCLRDHAIDACKLRRPDAAAAFGATSLFTLLQMVEAGLGATLLPEMAVTAGFADAPDLAVIPFAAPRPSRRIGLAWRRGSGRREEAEAIAGAFKAAMAAGAGKISGGKAPALAARA